MLRSVMVPSDFTDEFDLVLEFIEGLKSIGIRRVVLGHVVEASGMEGPVIAAKVDRVRETIKAKTDGLCNAGMDCEIRVSTGDDAARELLALATESHVDAVVMGTHGKGALSKLIERSVSEEVVWHASVPVLLVRYELLRDADHASELAKELGRQVIVSTDFSSASMRAFLALLQLPADSVGNACLLHTIDSGLGSEQLEKVEQGAQFQLRNMANIAEGEGFTVEPVVRYGDAKKAVLKEAEDRGATCIVAGTRGSSPLQEAMVGSVSMKLIRRANCPVMIVP